MLHSAWIVEKVLLLIWGIDFTLKCMIHTIVPDVSSVIDTDMFICRINLH